MSTDEVQLPARCDTVASCRLADSASAASLAPIRTRLRGLYAQATGLGLRGELIRGVAGTFAVKILGMVLAFANVVVLARVLGAQGYGVFAYALSLVTLLAIPTELGLPNLVMRQVALYHAREQWGLMRGLLVRGNQAVLLFSVTLALGAALVALIVADHISRQTFYAFLLALVSVPFASLAALRTATLRALRRVVMAIFPENVIRPGLAAIIVLVLAALLGREAVGPVAAMAVYACAAATAFLVGGVMLVRVLPQSVSSASSKHELRPWLTSAVPFMLIGGMQVINGKTDVIMLGLFRPMDEVGIYRGAVQLALLVSFPLQAMNLVLAPYYARLWAQNDMPRLQRLVTLGACGTLALSLPAAVLFIAAGGNVMSVAFGSEFSAGGTALALLSAGQLASATVGGVGVLLIMTGHERDTAFAVSLAAVANILLNASLIPIWGIDGAAIATGISILIWNVYLGGCVWYRLRLNPTAVRRRH